MMNGTEAREAWQKVCEIYDATREENRPAVTIQAIIKELGIEKTREVFAVISKIKKNDGRIYGRNREFMDSIPTDPSISEWSRENPMLHAGLDHIHTAHISNLITELRKFHKVHLHQYFDYM